MNPEHGTNAHYQGGCHCDECKRAHKIEQNKWLRKVGKYGPRRVSPEPTMNAVRHLRAAGVTWQEIARRAGCGLRSYDNFAKATYLNVGTRDRIHRAMRDALADLAERVADAEAALAFAGERPRQRAQAMWPTAPLLEWVKTHDISLADCLPASDRRYLYRYGMLDTGRADRCALALGVMPQDIWGPAWWDDEEGAA